MGNELTGWSLGSDFVSIKALVGNEIKTYYLEFDTVLTILWSDAKTSNKEGVLMLEMESGPDRLVADVLWDLKWNDRERVMNYAVQNCEAVAPDPVIEFDSVRKMNLVA